MISTIEELKKHYLFTKNDEKNLKKTREIVGPYADQFSNDFYEHLLKYPEAAQFFPTPGSIQKRKHTIKVWLMNLFSGIYDNRYYQRLKSVGRLHVKNGIPIHWVTASMNFKRDYLIDILEKEVEDTSTFLEYLHSTDKILDINLDILTSTYHEEEIKQKFLSARMDTVLISFAERFTYGLNIVLVLALIGLSIGLIGLFLSEVYRLIIGSGELEKNIISALGTLLIIWVMIELLGTEVKYLKGARFQIELFVSVALVAFIRELLIASIAHEAITKLSLMLAAILVLGSVYFLITRTKVK